MEHKSLQQLEIKSAARGEVEALFSRFNVIDHDDDVTLPGALQDGAPVRISAYNHESWKGALPVGRGTIHVSGSEAVLKGRFFLNTTQGRDTFEVVREMDELQQWSYGFDIKDSAPGEKDGRRVRFLKSLEVHEVSPVMLGAGIGTRTLAVKSSADWSSHPVVAQAIAFFEEYEAEQREASAFLQKIWEQHSFREAEHTLDELDATRWFGYIRSTDPSGHLTTLAYATIKMCADELGLPKHNRPIIKWFIEEDPAARAFARKTNTFHVGDRLPDVPIPLLGLADLANNVIWIKTGQSIPETINTVAHEVGHIAGLQHPEADAFGNKWGAGFTLDNTNKE